jgi:hypothetical protein
MTLTQGNMNSDRNLVTFLVNASSMNRCDSSNTSTISDDNCVVSEVGGNINDIEY